MISFNHNSSPSLVCSGNRIAHNVAANCRLRPSGLLLLIVLLLSSQSAFAQVHFASVLKDVEENNPLLLAAKKKSEASQLQAHVGALLPDPTVSAAFFKGDPTSIGNRWDLSVSQSFEMPSVLVRRARLRDLTEKAATLSYLELRQATLLEAQLCCADIIYYNAVSEIYERRNKAAIRIAQIYQKRYEQGDCTLIEYNTSQINLAQTQSITSEVNMQRDHYYRHLGILTGIENYQFFVDTFPDINVFSFFEQWYEPLEMNDPELQQLNNQVLSTRQQLDLSRSLWLPSVSLGYASENLANEAFRGIKVGVSIPIWSQQRSVKAANLAYQAARDEFESERIRRFTELRCMFHRQEGLWRNVNNLRRSLLQNIGLHETDPAPQKFRGTTSVDGTSQIPQIVLLDKALEAGEISLEQYLVQVDYYYSVELRIISIAYELEQLHLQLAAIEL